MGMREKLIEVLDVIGSCNAKYCCYCEFAEDIEGCVRRQKEIIADHLIANGVTIPVRCKDCKHYDNTEGIQWCHLNSKFAKWGMDWHSFPEDGFCSYGEKRTDGYGDEK